MVASLLSWERGLKLYAIETYRKVGAVAPLVGAWIEIAKVVCGCGKALSLLSWERGLKSFASLTYCLPFVVAPLVGAWIEILQDFLLPRPHLSRSSRGSVD